MNVRFALLLVALALNPAAAEWQPEAEDERQVRAHQLLQEIERVEGDAVESLMAQAHAFALFPKLSQTGLILGWTSGHGILIEDGKFTGYVRQRRLSLGFQFGRQSLGQLLLFRDEAAVEEFKQGRLEFTPRASVHATKTRRVAEAAHLPRVAAFSLTRGGLMVEAALGSTKFRFTPAATAED